MFCGILSKFLRKKLYIKEKFANDLFRPFSLRHNVFFKQKGENLVSVTKLRQMIRDGENVAVEFKRCRNELTNSVFETVSAFSNRYGGHILLGVEDNGEISGVNPKIVSDLKKNFINSLNDPNRFAPTLFIGLDELEIDGKIVLTTFVPPNSQIVMFGGKIYDRAEDGDIDITRNSEMVSHIHRRKSLDYTEREIFPYARAEEFDFERLMPKVRIMAANNRKDHPWKNMTDMQILKSAGLYEEDHKTGKTGYNLAAILLFGREELIASCTANYLTDCICRKVNLDRYDDRLVVKMNLIDAYDRLQEFITKHTSDRFFIIGYQRVSVRSHIAHEIISNILAHREYSSAFTAKIIIERNQIVTENWSLPKVPGNIDPDNFTPFSKNPLIANFFMNIGYADALGSGVRNLYKFTEIYSGTVPKLIDGDIFRTIVPFYDSLEDALEESAVVGYKSENVPINIEESSVKTEKVGGSDEKVGGLVEKVGGSDEKVGCKSEESSVKTIDKILNLIKVNKHITRSELANILGLTKKGVDKNIYRLKSEGLIERIGEHKGGHWKVMDKECSK